MGPKDGKVTYGFILNRQFKTIPISTYVITYDVTRILILSRFL